jgi:L-rhamnose mutarotase
LSSSSSSSCCCGGRGRISSSVKHERRSKEKLLDILNTPRTEYALPDNIKEGEDIEILATFQYFQLSRKSGKVFCSSGLYKTTVLSLTEETHSFALDVWNALKGLLKSFENADSFLTEEDHKTYFIKIFTGFYWEIYIYERMLGSFVFIKRSYDSGIFYRSAGIENESLFLSIKIVAENENKKFEIFKQSVDSEIILGSMTNHKIRTYWWKKNEEICLVEITVDDELEGYYEVLREPKIMLGKRVEGSELEVILRDTNIDYIRP